MNNVAYDLSMIYAKVKFSNMIENNSIPKSDLAPSHIDELECLSELFADAYDYYQNCISIDVDK